MNVKNLSRIVWKSGGLALALAMAPSIAPGQDIDVDEPAAGVEAAETGTGGSAFLVIIPERIDVEWYWYYYTDESQHLVQSAVEKELIRAGYDVIDLTVQRIVSDRQETIDSLVHPDRAAETGKELGAAYLVLGTATATQQSHNQAYGVNVNRYTADITAKIVRLSDGKILAVTDATETSGGEARKGAARKALREGGRKVARDIVREIGAFLPAPAD